MYELGEYLGCGLEGVVFRIKNYKRLIVKIYTPYNLKYFNLADQKEQYEKEILIAKKLRNYKIAVPRYAGIIKLVIPENIENKLLQKEKKNKGFFSKLFLRNQQAKEPTTDIEKHCMRLKDMIGKDIYGLVMEFIEEDVSMRKDDAMLKAYKKEIEKIMELGIMPVDVEDNLNVIWSKKHQKIYFIDFKKWIFPHQISNILQKILTIK